MDVEDIAPGQQFARTIDETIARCEIALIVIGPRWAEILQQRAREPQLDYVRHEIEAALARQITIVPVLVGGAGVAELAGLPGRLSALSQYEAAELRDTTFSDDCARLAKSLRLQPITSTGRAGRSAGPKPALMFVLGTTLLLVLLLAASRWLVIGPLREYRARKAAIGQMFATAKTQTDRGEYQSAFKTCQDLLKTDPGNRAALDQQVDAAMGWLDDFHVVAPEGGNAENLAGTLLDEIMPVLDAGLAKANGQRPRAADILAHIGWGHWLNQKLAQREFGSAAERDLRQALQIDPSNIFAHAMLGNWIMQTGGRTEEALMHFRMAVESNKARPLVRRLQLGVLVYPRDRETRLALVRLANEIRRNREPIDDRERSRILAAYDPTVNSVEELSETLSAVPPDEAWATYLWLDTRSNQGDASDHKRLQHDFIHASILEIEHNNDDALKAFEKLRSELKRQGYDGRIVTHVDNAIMRLSAR
jgi:tetratricopeptide (TPR) repeat protein